MSMDRGKYLMLQLFHASWNIVSLIFRKVPAYQLSITTRVKEDNKKLIANDNNTNNNPATTTPLQKT